MPACTSVGTSNKDVTSEKASWTGLSGFWSLSTRLSTWARNLDSPSAIRCCEFGFEVPPFVVTGLGEGLEASDVWATHHKLYEGLRSLCTVGNLT